MGRVPASSIFEVKAYRFYQDAQYQRFGGVGEGTGLENAGDSEGH